ncbi:hypothetical protein CAPTEDRAFT_196765 [Capitella teleta]|uniref:Uncharacterized protein n=1 Tax=Capitella teleta TaxID=283909 RepID=R7URG7_CAPTE|nr:hypothetical protein CAPTEDRAFT_196765 [Capitella teleta]|eukprot:ELU08795.1 hypothetical protein CAPTEDRAFT_196765 [Capitella teleta]
MYRLAPVPFTSYLDELTKVNDNQFNQLMEALREGTSLDTDEDGLTVLAEKTDLDIETVDLLMSVSSLIYKRCQTFNLSGGKLKREISRLVDSAIADSEPKKDLALATQTTEESSQLIKTRLERLVGPNTAYESQRKRSFLERGFLPVLTDLHTIVESRYVFDDKRDSVIGHLPIITGVFETDSDNSTLASFSVTLSIERIDDIIKELEIAKKKFALIENMTQDIDTQETKNGS